MVSAENGNPQAQYMMGVAYSDSEFEDFSIEKAKEWLLKALQNGVEDAKQELEELDKKYGGEKEYLLSWWSTHEFGTESEPIKTVDWNLGGIYGIEAKNEIKVILEDNDISLFNDNEKGRNFIRKFYDRNILDNPDINVSRIG